MSAINGSLMPSSLPLTPTREVDAPSSKRAQEEATRVAEEFESVFASLILKEMRKTLEPGGMFGEDSGDVYGGLFDQYLGQQMSQSGGFGMARMVREALQRSQLSSDLHAAEAIPAEILEVIEG